MQEKLAFTSGDDDLLIGKICGKICGCFNATNKV